MVMATETTEGYCDHCMRVRIAIGGLCPECSVAVEPVGDLGGKQVARAPTRKGRKKDGAERELP